MGKFWTDLNGFHPLHKVTFLSEECSYCRWLDRQLLNAISSRNLQWSLSSEQFDYLLIRQGDLSTFGAYSFDKIQEYQNSNAKVQRIAMRF